MRRVLIALLTTLPLAAASALGAAPPMGNGYGAIDAPRDTDPLALAQAFCQARMADDMSGVAAHFAPKLTDALNGADTSNVPWQTWPDHANQCSADVLNGFDNTVGVLVRITYSATNRKWSDVLNMERTPSTWLINNVFYETGGNLRFRLFQN